MKRQKVLLWLMLVAWVWLGLGAWLWVRHQSAPVVSGQGRPEPLRDYAALLKSNQLYAKAAEAYDQYLAVGDLSDAEKAKVDFNTASMLLDQVGDYEGALAHFLRVTSLYQGVDAQLVKEARKLSAECLEKLGRAGAAEHQLIESSKLKVGQATAETAVEEKDILATIGKRISITRADFDEAWKEIPQTIREQQFAGDEGRGKLLNELVSMRLFAEAARRKGLDRDPDIQRRRRQIEESLLSSKLFQTEVNGKVATPDSDLKLFYEAHLEHYQDTASVEIAHILTSDATQALAAKALIDHGSSFADVAKAHSQDTRTKENGGRLGKVQLARVPLEKPSNFDPYEVAIPGIGKERALVDSAFGLSDIGSVTGPVKTGRGYHLIQLISKTQAVQKTLEDARHQVESELRAQREEERKAELLAELMKAHEVKVYASRLKG
jgi:peptidyl-prolyl cis-trans isomerase C